MNLFGTLDDALRPLRAAALVYSVLHSKTTQVPPSTARKKIFITTTGPFAYFGGI